ncbi:MAG TPA: helix-turn-helix domain-containing protein [Chloroflexota bacterium]|nr:helix-turn-helix domain-containing protein [Chloroflexota bacterium]
MELQDLLGVDEAARLLGISADRMRVLLRHQRLPARKVAGRWVVASQDLALVGKRPPGRPRRSASREGAGVPGHEPSGRD